MTTAELLTALARECPNGVSFDPMAVRLLRQKIPFDDLQIRDLKSEMFQLGNGLWFSREMILDVKSLLAIREQATTWLEEHGCFSVDQLFNSFCDALRHLATPENFAAFLRHLGFTVAVWAKGALFCSRSPLGLDECLAAASKTIANCLEEADGSLALNEIEMAMPHLSAEVLESIRAQFLPEIHEAEVGGVPCWCKTEAIHLPEDFSERLTIVVDTLVSLNEKVSAAKLEFALNLFYRIRFREEYALTDNDTFMRICAKHYLGGNKIFPDMKKSLAKGNELSVQGKRVRSPNTRFGNLGVPIGAELIFVKDSNVTCTVLDDSNQVEYSGKAWAISALAIFLLGVSVANGFEYFSYEGETLLERRLRLERAGKQDEIQADVMPLPVEVQAAKKGIIGMEGRELSSSTWRLFRSAGTNPRVAEWARRVANGERIENIARESRLNVSTVKQYIVNRRQYFKICEKNGIVPEGGTDV